MIKNIITSKELSKPDAVDVEVPFDGGKIIGYIAGRKIPDPALMQRALDQYKVMMHDE